MIFRSRALLASVLTLTLLQAQTLVKPALDPLPIEVDRGAAGVARWLRALQTRASILMVTAHPDDEDGGMLAWATRGQGARGMLLTLNRGEGGQNAMSPDMFDRIGLVRTQELLQADRYYGVDQYWTSAIDYGFSKTREEALNKWDHERVLADAVRVIRMTRPLVITSVFVGAASDGHGNHQVAGEVAQEAYLAAGNPNRFPEQITKEGLKPWTPLKVYARVPLFAITPQGMFDYAIDKYVPVKFFDYVNEKWSDTKPVSNVEIQEGAIDPTSGLSYLQIGRAGLNFQKSQNSGVGMVPPGPFSSSYHRYGSRVPAQEKEGSFFDGIDTSINGIATLVPNPPESLKKGLSEISSDVAKAAATTRPGIGPILASGLSRTSRLVAEVQSGSLPEPGKSNIIYELQQKELQFQNAITAALGVSLVATVMPEKEPTGPFGGVGESFSIAIPGQSFGVQAQLVNGSAENVSIASATVTGSDGKAWTAIPKAEIPKSVASNADAKIRFTVTAPADAVITRPYFSRPNDEQPYYNIDDPRYRNESLAPYPLAATVVLNYHDVQIPLSQVVQSTQRIPGLGMSANPLLVGPAISVTVAPSAGAVPFGTKSFAFSATAHSNVKGPAKGTLQLNLPQGWKSEPAVAPFSMARDGEDQTITFKVIPGAVKPEEYKITAFAEYNGKRYEEGYNLVGYAGVRPYPYYRPAVYQAVGVDVKCAPGLKIGYLPGTGDEVPEGIRSLGPNVRILAASDITTGDLAGYDAILLGPRAYSLRQELKSANNRLLEYVKAGGVLIVQYNLQGFDRDYGPYPFSLGGNPQKVVDEASKVTILNPASPVFNWPNKITEADFKGWVEERGHGFMATWDDHYEALLETHDPAEDQQDPQKGGLLLARYGKGAYIYDAYALYRQLPSGVPGAYRIVANLISLSKNPGFVGAAKK
jgi:LmbE family N-acetylglucosaminyl deacetylase